MVYVIMLSVNMLNVVMLSALAPLQITDKMICHKDVYKYHLRLS